MDATRRRVRDLGQTEDGRHVFEDLDYPADAPRTLRYRAYDVLAHPGRYCTGGQCFALSAHAAASWGDDRSRPVCPPSQPERSL